MSNYSLPLFMQVKENAVSDLNKNLNLYMPKLVFARALILTTEGLLQTLDKFMQQGWDVPKVGFYTNSTYGMDISGAPTGERAEKLGNYLINDNYSPCVLNAKRMRAPTETVIFADSQSA